mmetsp:Transcript_37604/g.49505  ORF Transcript_37604/g.49505 Transcript_37604/m.49505 type:complete len:200 (-) Transcript_37604:126-725(-)
MLLGLFDVLFRLFRVSQRLTCVVINFYKIRPLFMNLRVDVFGDGVDISHELLDVIELVLSLVDDLFHVGSLALNLELLAVELDLLLQQTVFLVVARSSRVAIGHALISIHQINVLLHLQINFLHHLLELVADIVKSLSVGILLFLLLLLGAIGHTNVAVLLDERRELLLLLLHVFHALVHARAQVVTIALCANLFFLLS